MSALFFDVDGTLIDSRRDLINTVNATRADLSLAPISDEAVMACVGNGARYLLEHAIPEAAGRFDEVWPLHRRNYEANMMRTVSLYPGVAETLQRLRAAGCKLGIVTNKPNWATRKILQHLDALEFFDAIVAGGDTELMKPHAAPLLECAARMGVGKTTPADWMVGDNWTDIACGARAGASTAFCNYGFGELRDTIPTRRIDSFAELVQV